MAPEGDRLRPGHVTLAENACIFPYEDVAGESTVAGGVRLSGRRVFIGPRHQVVLHVAAQDSLELEGGAETLGFHVWPGTHAMAHLVLQLEEQGELAEKSVLDMGCGTGFVGILASLAGARRTVLADGEVGVLRVAEVNVAANALGDRVQVQESNWEDAAAPSTSGEVFDFVLLSEVLYVAQPTTVPWRLVDSEVASVMAVAKAKLSKDGTALVTYGNREEGGRDQLRAAAGAAGLVCEELPLAEVVPAEDLALAGAESLRRVLVFRLRHQPG